MWGGEFSGFNIYFDKYIWHFMIVKLNYGGWNLEISLIILFY